MTDEEVLCFLKSKPKLLAIMRENPGIERWWIEQEIVGKGRFGLSLRTRTGDCSSTILRR